MTLTLSCKLQQRCEEEKVKKEIQKKNMLMKLVVVVDVFFFSLFFLLKECKKKMCRVCKCQKSFMKMVGSDGNRDGTQVLSFWLLKCENKNIDIFFC